MKILFSLFSTCTVCGIMYHVLLTPGLAAAEAWVLLVAVLWLAVAGRLRHVHGQYHECESHSWYGDRRPELMLLVDVVDAVIPKNVYLHTMLWFKCCVFFCGLFCVSCIIICQPDTMYHVLRAKLIQIIWRNTIQNVINWSQNVIEWFRYLIFFLLL